MRLSAAASNDASEPTAGDLSRLIRRLLAGSDSKLRWAAFLMSRGLLVIVFAILGGCGADWLFSKHVYSGPDETIMLFGEKLDCMRCPAYFNFKAERRVIDHLINSHKLVVAEEAPSCIVRVLELGARELSWWKLPSNAEVFGACYEGVDVRYEPEFRVLIVSGDQAFFGTSLHFNPEFYKRTF